MTVLGTVVAPRRERVITSVLPAIIRTTTAPPAAPAAADPAIESPVLGRFVACTGSMAAGPASRAASVRRSCHGETWRADDGAAASAASVRRSPGVAPDVAGTAIAVTAVSAAIPRMVLVVV